MLRFVWPPLEAMELGLFMQRMQQTFLVKLARRGSLILFCAPLMELGRGRMCRLKKQQLCRWEKHRRTFQPERSLGGLVSPGVSSSGLPLLLIRCSLSFSYNHVRYSGVVFSYGEVQFISTDANIETYLCVAPTAPTLKMNHGFIINCPYINIEVLWLTDWKFYVFTRSSGRSSFHLNLL